ncbi:MAG: divalent metal cation transporter, partial [Calditerricola sp.]|nr:divalent metal cation transporter [Calditerricola sp.]
MTRNWSLLLGAAFLMATSAIGPGFLTQTTVFTEQLGASFGFVILMSILLDIGAQLNIWRVIAVSEKRAQDIANAVLPGLGYLLAALVAMGGLAFNIGNVAGAGMGMNVLFGLNVKWGAVLSALIAVALFLVREAGKAMDRFAQLMGFVMIALTLYVAIVSGPPVGEAVVKSFWPDTVDTLAIVTLVGGTVGGYITFAGGHRLLDAGLRGPGALPEVSRSAVSGILIASVMRVVLFLAALGVVSQGLALNPDNPPASVFQHAAGTVGYKLFGMVMWAA